MAALIFFILILFHTEESIQLQNIASVLSIFIHSTRNSFPNWCTVLMKLWIVPFFIFYGFGCTAVRTKTIRMKMWFTWEMKISIKIYFLVILWSVKILEKTFFWNDVFKYAIVVQKLKRWNNVCFWEYQKNDCSLT